MKQSRRSTVIFTCTFILLAACNTAPSISSTSVATLETSLPIGPSTLVEPTLTPNVSPGLTPRPSAIPSPTIAVPASMTPIYVAIATYDSHQAQLWQIVEPTSRLLYQSTTLTANDPAVSADVKDAIQSYLAQSSSQTILSEVELGIYFHGLRISNDKKHLAWIESFDWCPDPTIQKCFGFARIAILNLETNLVEWSIPADHALSDTLSWSPDNRHLAYATQTTDEYGGIINQVWVADMATQEISSLGKGDLPAWSPDGQRLALVFHPSLSSSDWRIKIISIDNPSLEKVIDYPWKVGPDILNWKSGTDLLTTAGSTDPIANIGAHNIFLIDTKALSVSIFPAQTTFAILSNPHWSSDGSLLAANAREKYGDNVRELVIFNSFGEALSTFDVSGYSPTKWMWSNTELRILRLLGSSPPSRDDLQILDPVSGNIDIVELSVEISTGIENFATYISDITW